MNFNRHRHLIYLLLVILLTNAISACKFEKPDRKNISFNKVIGISYTEVKRRLNTGRSFDTHGYEVNPDWRMSFISKDSSSIFSPDSNRFLTFPVMLDHDSLFNTGNTWLRAKKVTKDSMIFQVMAVETRTIYLLRSNVYMTFYANDYIKKHNLKLADLQKPDRKDTSFVREMAAMADKYPDSLFSGRDPVVMQSRNQFVSVEKVPVVGTRENHFDTSDAYMYPEYKINIHHAYEDFSYYFTAYVDANGNIIFKRNLVATMMGKKYDDSVLRVIKAIIDGYLKTYIQVTPGSTLGIKHNTLITLSVRGFKK